MSDNAARLRKQSELRLKAVSRLTSPADAAASSTPAAYQVLHKLATSPTTATDALALLHELQVHQVELEMQAEEMQDLYTDLEAILHRQCQLYESAPVGYFTLDCDTVLIHLNNTGSQLLESSRELLLGRPLNDFLLPDSALSLQARIRDIAAGQQVGTCELQLTVRDGKSRTVHASINADPNGTHFLVAFMPASAHRPTHDEPSNL